MEGSCESIENLSNQCKNSLPIKISFFKTKGDIISISISGNNVGIFGFSAPTTKGRWLSHTSTRVIILPIVNIQIFFSSILALWNFFFLCPMPPSIFFFFALNCDITGPRQYPAVFAFLVRPYFLPLRLVFQPHILVHLIRGSRLAHSTTRQSAVFVLG